jgi:hypothetical protein
MAIIPHTAETGKIGPGRLPDGLLTALVVLLASSASYGLGILTGQDMTSERGGVEIQQVAPGADVSASAALAPIPKSPKSGTVSKAYTPPAKQEKTGTATAETGKYVASKNGTKYYLPSCGTANRINEENKIYFNTKEEAEAAGFGPSSTCKGL